MELSKAKVEALPQLDMRELKTPGIRLLPVGDIHYGTQDTAEDKLQEYINWGLRHDAYFLGMGDYFDFSSPSNRAVLSDARVHDSTRRAIDERAEELRDKLVSRVLAPTRGRWVGLLRGHHWWLGEDNVHSDQALANDLGAPYLGTCAIVGLRFKEGICNVWCHHGWGGGVTLGAPLLQLQRATAAFDAHIYLVAHQHKLVTGKPARVHVNWRGKQKLRNISLTLACTGSFMRSYTEGRTHGGRPQGSYVEERGLMPAALGGIVLDIAPYKYEGLFDPEVWVTLQ